MAAAHGAVRHTGAIALHLDLPPTLLHVPEELLELPLGQLVQRDLPQPGNQMTGDKTLILELCGGAQPGLCVILVPLVQPVTEEHIQPHLGRPDAAALPFQLFQLGHALLFRFRQNIYQYGIADVPYYLKKLEDQGYITSGDIRKTLSMQTLPNLKAFMVKNHLNTNGKKGQLIDRILQSISNEVLEQEFATKYYVLTAKGKQELEDNQYLFENPNTDQSIWTLNRRHVKKLKNGASKPARKHSRKLSPKNYSRKKWTSAAWQAKKDKDYLLEIKLLLNVLYHDLAQVDEQKDTNTLKFIEKNLQYYFPYAHSIIKPAPGLVEEIQLAVKRIGVDNIGLSEIVRSVVAEQEVDPLFFKKGEVIAIINAELINDITTVSHVFDTVYQRIKNMD